jgi:hypothetical protein
MRNLAIAVRMIAGLLAGPASSASTRSSKQKIFERAEGREEEARADFYRVQELPVSSLVLAGARTPWSRTRAGGKLEVVLRQVSAFLQYQF